jgi:hypothetical protein
MATGKVRLNCARIVEPDLAVIDQLARIQLEARRRGCTVCLADAGSELLELICFAGLEGALRVEVKRQPEQREQPRGVEEEGELGDPPVL